MAAFEPKQFGKYVLLEKLAVGGMAEIYKAKTYGAEGFEKLLALKKILPHAAADTEFITMLIDEAKLSVLLSHANIVQVFDLGKVGDDFFITMEYINGVNLRDVLYRIRERTHKLPPEFAVFIVSELAKGLDYAHRKTDSNGRPLGIVHRDISPQNILISYEGEVKIVDFGIAKAAMNISHTMAGILKGKIAYMSPEQALGKAIDYRTDIFSTGILLYETLTGQKLFTGESQFEVLKKIRTTRIDTTKLPDSIPAPLKDILSRVLAFKPEDRYQSAGDLQIALTRYLYSTYPDFASQKLAAYIKELFIDLIREQQETSVKLSDIAHQTASINAKEEAEQENIVHRENGSVSGRRRGRDRDKEEEVAEATRATPLSSSRRKTGTARKARSVGIWKAASLTAVLALAGFAALRFMPALRFWENQSVIKEEVPPAEPSLAEPIIFTGTAHLVSDPPTAKIFVDNRDTGLTTPAILDKLTIGQTYKIRFEKELYAPLEKNLEVIGDEPMELQALLQKNTGVLSIISEPSGAAILVNGRATGLMTPATLETLALHTDYQISLSKPEYLDFEQTVNLTDAVPQKVSAMMKKIVTEAPAPPPPPAPVVKEEPETGTLLVRSEPSGARVIIDGKETGKTTPATLSDLKLGTYRIQLKKEDFETASRRMTLSSAKPVTLSQRLKQIQKEALPTASPTPAPAVKSDLPATQSPTPQIPIETPSPPTPTPLPAAAEESGEPATIKLSSNPSGAEVFINSEYQGTTPLTIRARPGLLTILLNKEGKKSFTKKITVAPGEKVNLLNISLGELYGQISINTTPPRADVILDGQVIGAKTPVTIRNVRRDKQHILRLEAYGYEPWERTFDMEESTDKKFNVIFERE